MKPLPFILRVLLLVVLNLAVAAATAEQAPASEAAPRVTGPVDDAVRVVLHGNANSLAQNKALSSAAKGHAMPQSGTPQSGTDLGTVEDSLPAGRMLLLLQRSAGQEAALDNFIHAAHSQGDAAYHQWLKPGEFGRLYGPANSDVAAVTAWMESHGLTIQKVHSGRVAIEFTATAGQLREAFRAPVHRVVVNGQQQLTTVVDPSVPAAIAPVVAGLAPVNDIHPKSNLKVLGQAHYNPKTHQATPQWTYTGGNYVVAPNDFAVQYDIASVYKSGTTGAGQSIGIISASNVDLSLVQAYQTLFGLSANLPVVVVDGEDPGQTSAATEAYLDIELAGAVAPGATVILYTSAGTALTDGLALAAYRAVEDDLASVISVSYGECELSLGQSGNAFWSALWQQAAAQGQTVFVSSGDGGSAGCDNFDTQSLASDGLQVNGIASTPYNVAVGGTDFYYSNYASVSLSSTQLATYWSKTSTTSPAVSMLQTIPEQAWNDFFGYNLYDQGTPSSSFENIIASGGGASSIAYYPNGATAGIGYPKPAWQTGTGVPSDGVRDLPDVSLFAANGYNDSYYPICASPGDCSSANLNSSGTEFITGVGGTSASSPAMAAIQALVNQSTGSWAGQADFVYYSLASKAPSSFHDITFGGNRVPCYQTTTNCVAGSSATNSSGFYVENGYAAGVGYDLATGLGSVDVANLIANWSKATFAATTTTLSVSPTSIVHGKTVTISGAVAPSKGSGTPTGSVSLNGNDGLSHYAAIDDISLAAGSLYTLIDNLPGGTYQLTAVYGGDGTFAASTSSPVTVTVAPENDTLYVTGWALNPSDLYLYPLSAGITLPYGAQIYLDVQPTSGNATISTEPTPATGSITYNDKLASTTTSSAQPLNAAGLAEWSTGVFAPGSHTVTVAYSGDPSYKASSATAASFTIISGSTSLVVKPLVSSVTAGASVAVDVQLTAGYLPLYGALPTGNVTVTLGGSSITVPWQSFGTTGNATLEAVATFTNVPAGILPVTAYYAGDSNWIGSAATGGTVISLSSKLTPAVTLTASTTSPSPSQSFTLTAVVAGATGKATPTGSITFLSDAQSFYSVTTLVSGTATLSLHGYTPANGTNVFTAVYQGDTNYNAASSNALNITSQQSDFSLTTQSAALQISPSGSAICPLSLTPLNGFSGTVTLTVTAPTGITATLAAASPTLSANLTDALTINVAASKASGIYPLTVTASGGGHVHTAQVLVQVLVVAAPIFSPAGGNYTTTQSVTITDASASATTGATIYYTTNGTTPTTSSTKYTGAIAVSATETIEAIAVLSNYAPSSVSSATYIFPVSAATPVFSPTAGTYASAQSVTITDATSGATIYYTTNGTTPTTSSTKYTGAITVSSAETLQAIATATGSLQSATASAIYILNTAANGCPVGSGSCSDNFTGASGTLLPTYNPKWVLAGGTNAAFTTGSNSAEISGSSSAVYYYAGSTSDTSQITVSPSSTTISYARLACVRVSTGIPGYCVGFSPASSGNYSACYVMKNFHYLGSGSCATLSASVSHALTLVASGTTTVTLSIYVDGVASGTVTDSSSPYTIAGPGFGLQGDGTAANSAISEWQDYTALPATYGCLSGSGSCFDAFTGSSGTTLTSYNSAWVLAGGTNAVYTTGSDSAQVSSYSSSIYYYTGSTSDTSQITVSPSSTTIGYARLACVRVSAGVPGYCVGFSAVSSGTYNACYVMKNFHFLGGVSCSAIPATTSHTLRLSASGSSTVTLSIYVDGILEGTVADSSSPYTVAGSGFGLQGDGTPADSAVTRWQDYAPAANGCPTGSGSCFDNFMGSAGMSIPTYNSNWVLAGGSNAAYTSGSDSAEVSGSSSAIYYYAASASDTSQITVAPSSTTIAYARLACVRVSSGIPGYCVGFGAFSSGNYNACYVMKNFHFLGAGNCSAISAAISHTLRLVASGSSTVTLSIYVDGVLSGTVTDSSSPYTVAGSGFGVQGDGTPADSAITEWQDYAFAQTVTPCASGSGSCVDTFTGASGTLLPAYNSNWVLAGGSNAAFTTGSGSAEISASNSAIYYYASSSSETSQITVAPSSTTIGYARLACVRVSAGVPGYCVGFSAVSSGNYTACYVMKNFHYQGGGSCATVSAATSHTLRLVASGTTTVTLTIYVDGVASGTVSDSSSPYTVTGSGFGLQGDGTSADSAVTKWQDYASN